MIFLLRIVLRKDWLAIAAFIAVFLALNAGSSFPRIDAVAITLTNGLAAIVLVRFGLIALCAGVFVHDALIGVPVTLNTSAPYFSVSILIMAIAFAFCFWAFRNSIRGSQLWHAELFEAA